jgi:hypothetical protein
MGHRLFARFCACCEPTDGSALTRRDALDGLARGGLAALLAAGALAPVRAADDDVVRIGYLPITELPLSWSRTPKGISKTRVSRSSRQH